MLEQKVNITPKKRLKHTHSERDERISLFGSLAKDSPLWKIMSTLEIGDTIVIPTNPEHPDGTSIRLKKISDSKVEVYHMKSRVITGARRIATNRNLLVNQLVQILLNIQKNARM